MFEQPVILNKNRYRLYREHKYVFHVFSKLLQLASSLDFSQQEAIVQFRGEMEKLALLLQAHAEHEENRIHLILKNKNSSLFQEAEKHHQDQKLFFAMLTDKLHLLETADKEEAHFIGYGIYLDLRNFLCENLIHFDYEERIIMPELQRLVSDEEIREIDRIAYRQMQPEQIVHMLEILFPHMNANDKFHFLNDIKTCEPQKFAAAWAEIAARLTEVEKTDLEGLLQVPEAVEE